MDENGLEPGRPPRREREKIRHREEILDAAAEIFARHGYEGASMQQIADLAELSVGKLYTHFDGKEAIYREVLGRIVSGIEEACSAAILPGMTPLQKIRARGRAAVEYFRRYHEFIRFYFEMNPEGSYHVGRCADDAHSEAFALLIREAIDQGELSPELDPAVHAVMLEGAAHRLLEVFGGMEREDLPPVDELIDRVFFRPYEIKPYEIKKEESGKDKENG